MSENKGYTHPEALVDADWVQRGRIAGVGIAKDMAIQQLHMVAKLTGGIESSSCIVQVDLPLRIQARVLRRPEFVEERGGIKCRVVLFEGDFCLLHPR